MTWRGSNTISDRIIACLVYAFPLLEVAGFGVYLFEQIPWLGLIYLPLFPFLIVYGFLNSVLRGYGSILIFFALYIGVVRNERFRHFLRFNTMQALMLAIFAYLCSTILQLLGLLQIPTLISLPTPGSTFAPSAPLLVVVILDLIFLVVWAGSVFSIVQAARGLYGELPVISDASYAQTR